MRSPYFSKIPCSSNKALLMVYWDVTYFLFSQSNKIASWNSIVYVLLPRYQIMHTRLIKARHVLFMAIKRRDGDRMLLD